MEADLLNLLRGDVGVTALVPITDSITWDKRVGLPAVALYLIVGVPIPTQDGPSGFSNSTIQIDCWASTPTAAHRLRLAVEAAVDGYRGGSIQSAFVQARRSGGELDGAAPADGSPSDLHRKSLDLGVQHST